MKLLILLCVICYALAGRTPDDAIKLDPKFTGAVDALAGGMLINKKQGTVMDRTKLVDRLLIHSHYDKRVNPDDVKLKMGVSLIDFKICEKRNIMESLVWLRFMWQDDRLKWDPKDFGGVEIMRIAMKEMWKPDMTLYNSADPVNMIDCHPTNAILTPNGKVLWVPPCKLVSSCHMHLAKHPFGEQTCSLKFGSWTFDANVLDLDFMNDMKEIDLTEMTNTSGFDIIHTTAEKHMTHYKCCKEPYPDLTFNITMKRIPALEMFNRM